MYGHKVVKSTQATRRYNRVSRRIRKTSLVVLGCSTDEMVSRLKHRRSILKMLGIHYLDSYLHQPTFNFIAVVVISFFLCWAPFHTQRLMYVLQHYRSHILRLSVPTKSYFLVRINWFTDEVYYAVNEKLFYVTGMFLYLNATVNPIVNHPNPNMIQLSSVHPCLDL